MRFHFGSKDGGPESTVWMYGFEWKRGFSVLLLRFHGPSRHAFHEHAFNAISWLLYGGLSERFLNRGGSQGYRTTWPREIWPSPRPIITPRTHFHKVDSIGTSWVLSFRGPWKRTWREYVPGIGYRLLANGREVID